MQLAHKCVNADIRPALLLLSQRFPLEETLPSSGQLSSRSSAAGHRNLKAAHEHALGNTAAGGDATLTQHLKRWRTWRNVQQTHGVSFISTSQ